MPLQLAKLRSKEPVVVPSDTEYNSDIEVLEDLPIKASDKGQTLVPGDADHSGRVTASLAPALQATSAVQTLPSETPTLAAQTLPSNVLIPTIELDRISAPVPLLCEEADDGLNDEKGNHNFYMHVRDMDGHVTGAYKKDPGPSHVMVPSLGPVVDAFLDAFRFSVSFCFEVQHAFEIYDGIDDFSMYMETTPEKEAAAAKWHENKGKINDVVNAVVQICWDKAAKIHKELQVLTPKKFYKLIVQRRGKKLPAKAVSRWNAYLCKKAQEVAARLSPDANRPKIFDIAREAADEWADMCEGECIKATKGIIAEIEELRENQKYVMHSTEMAMFHDVRATLNRWDDELTALNSCTGHEIFYCGVRPDFYQYTRPRMFATSKNVEEFFPLCLKMDCEKFAKKMECFMLAGVEGAKTNHYQELCCEACPQKVLCRGCTKTYRKNQLQDILFCPGSINSMPELIILKSAPESGATSFCKLSAKELEAWRKEQFDQLITEHDTIEQETAEPWATSLSLITSLSATSTDDVLSVAASVVPPPTLATAIAAPPPVPATATAVPSSAVPIIVAPPLAPAATVVPPLMASFMMPPAPATTTEPSMLSSSVSAASLSSVSVTSLSSLVSSLSPSLPFTTACLPSP
ncbi:uncharacterized protein PHACADRAFT_202454 [Phanerochaete carnosa HHB-10118-sp]|uniref:Uncharacterized protein n=1 Tax=Phanerochaete carnosa (strain HHB-10118-sp) TaxID=650164 RepID=K5VQ74_PHACS|nr:uncharacterized protein PHACADRAFT_202454 [Phanerochaete carnosa HHB-10118-sp]EKM48744.1 hypothetical protein PHACADRAFT_202454 [Phanerochaete carnosa HHB-10118-sp]